MAVGTTKIWVRIVKHGEKRSPILVEVNQDATIHDVVVEAIKAELLSGTVSVGMVNVSQRNYIGHDAEVRRGAQVSNYANTTDSNPLLFQIKDEGT